jgi:hypothetical protein
MVYEDEEIEYTDNVRRLKVVITALLLALVVLAVIRYFG